MEIGHIFDPEHGYTGSAHVTKEMRPHVHGFKRGGNVAGHKMAKGDVHGMTSDETGPIEGIPVENMKHGGLSHIKSHHKNYAHGGRVEHDGHPKHDHGGHYDKHGFHIHHTKGHKK